MRRNSTSGFGGPVWHANAKLYRGGWSLIEGAARAALIGVGDASSIDEAAIVGEPRDIRGTNEQLNRLNALRLAIPDATWKMVQAATAFSNCFARSEQRLAPPRHLWQRSVMSKRVEAHVQNSGAVQVRIVTGAHIIDTVDLPALEAQAFFDALGEAITAAAKIGTKLEADAKKHADGVTALANKAAAEREAKAKIDAKAKAAAEAEAREKAAGEKVDRCTHGNVLGSCEVDGCGGDAPAEKPAKKPAKK